MAGEGLPDFGADHVEEREPWMDFYLDAFFELDSDRNAGGMPIPWTSIDGYAQRHGILGRDFDIFKDLVRALDKAALKRNRNDGNPGTIQQEDGTDSGTSSSSVG